MLPRVHHFLSFDKKLLRLAMIKRIRTDPVHGRENYVRNMLKFQRFCNYERKFSWWTIQWCQEVQGSTRGSSSSAWRHLVMWPCSPSPIAIHLTRKPRLSSARTHIHTTVSSLHVIYSVGPYVLIFDYLSYIRMSSLKTDLRAAGWEPLL